MFRPIVRTLVTLLLLAMPVAAQDVDAIFSRYNAAIDPEGKVATFKGMKVRATFEIAAVGMRAEMTVHQAVPNQSLTIVTIPGMGEMRQGSDGTTVWSSDPMGGPRILTGTEAAPIADGANVDFMRRSRASFTSVEPAGEGEFDGEKCMRLKLVWKSGRTTTECYSTTSGLVIETAGKQVTPQGELDTSTRMYDYKPVGGILMPHRVVMSMMGIQQVVTLVEVTAGEQDPTLFALPPAIRALKGNP